MRNVSRDVPGYDFPTSAGIGGRFAENFGITLGSVSEQPTFSAVYSAHFLGFGGQITVPLNNQNSSNPWAGYGIGLTVGPGIYGGVDIQAGASFDYTRGAPTNGAQTNSTEPPPYTGIEGDWMLPPHLQGGFQESSADSMSPAVRDMLANIDREDAEHGAEMRANEIFNNIDREDAERGAEMRANEIFNNLDREDADLGDAMRANAKI